MGKTIIVTDVDIPNKCIECNFLYSTYSIYCYLTKKDIDDVYNRPKWCPLKGLPEKEDIDPMDDDYFRGYTNGWNDCLKEIEEK